MKITKKHFIESMTTNKSVFLGVMRKLLTSDETYCKIRDCFNPDIIIEQRTATAKSNKLVFSGGSILGFEQNGNYTFYEYAYPEGTVYVCNHEYYDNWDEEYKNRCMYYLVK